MGFTARSDKKIDEDTKDQDKRIISLLSLTLLFAYFYTNMCCSDLVVETFSHKQRIVSWAIAQCLDHRKYYNTANTFTTSELQEIKF